THRDCRRQGREKDVAVIGREFRRRNSRCDAARAGADWIEAGTRADVEAREESSEEDGEEGGEEGGQEIDQEGEQSGGEEVPRQGRPENSDRHCEEGEALTCMVRSTSLRREIGRASCKEGG